MLLGSDKPGNCTSSVAMQEHVSGECKELPDGACLALRGACGAARVGPVATGKGPAPVLGWHLPGRPHACRTLPAGLQPCLPSSLLGACEPVAEVTLPGLRTAAVQEIGTRETAA